MGVRGRVILFFGLLGIAFVALVMVHEERVVLVDSAGAFYASCSRSLAMQAQTALAQGNPSEIQKQVAMAGEGPGVQYAAVEYGPGDVLASVGGPPPALAASHLLSRIQDAEIRSASPRNFLVVHPIGTQNEGRVVLAISEEALTAHLQGDGRWRLWSLALLALVACVVAFWADRHVSSSTTALLKATQEIAEGKVGRRVNIRTGDRLEELGENFNRMSERIKVAEEKLRGANIELNTKVEELGLLASGLAHELNNPLAAIAAMAEDLVDRIADGDTDTHGISARLSAVQHEISRCHRLVTDLLSFARPHVARQEFTDLAPLLEHVIRIAEESHASPNVRIRAVVPEILPPAVGGADAIQQVFLNLLSNAVEASPEGGTVQIRVKKVPGAIHAEFSDQGNGIPEALQERIFEPFFTTKSGGRGTGLGLAIVRRIMSALGGRIWIENSGTGGTTFAVELGVAS